MSRHFYDKRMEQNIEKICRNCSLYKDGACGVTIIKEGECYEITTEPNDECIWEEMGIEVNQIRVWSDGKNGYIEYPKNLYEDNYEDSDEKSDTP